MGFNQVGTNAGDYFVVSDAPLQSLSDIIREIHNAPVLTSTGKRMTGANARRRRQFRRGTIGGIQRSTHPDWRAHTYSGGGRITLDIIDCD